MISQILSKAFGNAPILARAKCILFHKREVGESSPGCSLSECPQCGIVYNAGGYVLDSRQYYLFKAYDALFHWLLEDSRYQNLAQAMENFHFLASDSSNCGIREHLKTKYACKYSKDTRFQALLDAPEYLIPFSYSDNRFRTQKTKE